MRFKTLDEKGRRCNGRLSNGFRPAKLKFILNVLQDQLGRSLRLVVINRLGYRVILIQQNPVVWQFHHKEKGIIAVVDHNSRCVGREVILIYCVLKIQDRVL